MIQIKSALDEYVFFEAPCDLCPHRARCREGQACAAFASFIVDGGHRWRALPREPSRAQYTRLFSGSLEVNP
jgi:hypothetical protein